jgi:hypothetical protein
MAVYKRANRNWMFWLTMLAIFCLLFYVLRSVLLPFVAGIIIGYLLDPFTTKLQKAGVKNRALATVLVMLLVFIILTPALALLIGVIDEQVGRFLSAVPEYAANFAKRIEPFFIELQDKFPGLQADKVREYIRGNLANSMKLAGSVMQKLVSGGFALVNLLSLLLITPVVAFYMLRDWHSFLGNVDELLPEKYKDTIRNLAKQIDRILAGFIRGQLSVCVLLGTFYASGLYLVGLELGVLVGFIAGLISFIPYVGSISGFVVSMGIALAQFDSWGPIAQVVAVFMVGQFIEGNFLTPKLVGDNVGLHPVWVMFALLAGGVLLGFLGLMIAVPVAAIIGVLIRYAIEQYKESSLYLE